MIHDAKVEVTCDYGGCTQSVFVELNYGYHSYSGESGQYDHSESSIEKSLVDEDWTVVDGKHYCDWHIEEDIKA